MEIKCAKIRHSTQTQKILRENLQMGKTTGERNFTLIQ